MKTIKTAAIFLGAFFLASVANAITTFHVDNGYVGTAVFAAAGPCQSRTVYENAVYGTVLNDSNANIGTGLVSADGQLLALLDEGLKLSGFMDASGMRFGSTYFTDFSSNSTENTFRTNGSCEIIKSIGDSHSRLVYAADFNKGFDKVVLRYAFTAYEPMVEVNKNGNTLSKSRISKGSILFKGSRPVI